MTYGSVCSGIEAATVAWSPLGWEPAWFAEIDKPLVKFLNFKYPEVPVYGKVSSIATDLPVPPIDLLCGGTPCQSFSMAGSRGGLCDLRGEVSIEFCKLAGRLRPRWIMWENVPGVLSADGGKAFSSIIGALVELGYGIAYRVLDAQFFGVPQRRRRVYLIGYFGDWRRAAAVLFESESLCGNTAKGGETPSIVAALSACGVGTCGADDNQAQVGHIICRTLNAGGTLRLDLDSETFVARPKISRLTITEAERLMGFPDRHTETPGASESRRYKWVGNSWAVPVIRWIGERIERINSI